MENKQVNKPVLKYTNKENTQTFSEGDAVICFTKYKPELFMPYELIN